MTDCCASTACELDKLRATQSRTLKLVLAINILMFVVEFTAGMISGSTALLADSLDMLGDAFVYGFSLYVVARTDAWKSVSALLKSVIMAGFGLFVLGQAIYKVLYPVTPQYDIIAMMATGALAANAFCLYLLWSHRADDVNMSSIWLCSRNDIIANLSVMVAAAGVWITDSQWPDLVIGLGIAYLFLTSAVRVFRDASDTWTTYHRKLDSQSH